MMADLLLFFLLAPDDPLLISLLFRPAWPLYVILIQIWIQLAVITFLFSLL